MKNYFKIWCELLVASLCASFVIGLILSPMFCLFAIKFGPQYFLMPYLILLAASIIMATGTTLALPAIFVGASFLLLLSSKGYRKVSHYIFSGFFVGIIYGLSLTLLPSVHNFFSVPLFSATGALTGYFFFSARIKNSEQESPL